MLLQNLYVSISIKKKHVVSQFYSNIPVDHDHESVTVKPTLTILDNYSTVCLIPYLLTSSPVLLSKKPIGVGITIYAYEVIATAIIHSLQFNYLFVEIYFIS